ncbi:uncharacterized protein LOC118485851 [Helianthus annuus]|uniref:uncharacterized protein LOC118485851 n=1 Tax=Helianthus annuus TaxID=4232 RepID=UPI001652EF25|nr:uncharacterized protein LOC118485851 [Helianthus annuus]
MSKYKGLKMKELSTIAEFAEKISGIGSRSASLGTVIEEEKLVKGFYMVFRKVGFDDLVGLLIAYEERVNLEDKEQPDEDEENNLIQRVEPVLYLQTHVEEANDVFLDKERIIPRVYTSSLSELNTWFLDNGASNHMTGKKEWFTHLDHNIKGKVKFGDGSCVEIKGRGMVVLEGKSGEQRVLRVVYYIPALESNIISIGQLDKIGYKIAIQDGILWMFEQH